MARKCAFCLSLPRDGHSQFCYGHGCYVADTAISDGPEIAILAGKATKCDPTLVRESVMRRVAAGGGDVHPDSHPLFAPVIRALVSYSWERSIAASKAFPSRYPESHEPDHFSDDSFDFLGIAECDDEVSP